LLQSKSYNSPHQIIGIVTLIFFVIRLPLGFVAHRQMQRIKDQTLAVPAREHYEQPVKVKAPLSSRITSWIYISSGCIIILTSVINTGIGFDFAVSSVYNRVWVPVEIGFFIILLIALGVHYMWSRTRKDIHEERDEMKYGTDYDARVRQAQAEAYQMQQYGAPAPAQAGQAPAEHGEINYYPNVQVPKAYQ
jgi:preprotein translocase subunit SecG